MHRIAVVVLLILPVVLAGSLWAEPPVRLVTAVPFGTAGPDRASAVALGPDGSIYVAGRLGARAETLGAQKPALSLGRIEKAWRYGRAFVAKFSPDGQKLLAWCVMAPGACRLTDLVVSEAGVYAAGYAGPGLEPALADLGGLQTRGRYDQRDYKLHTPGEHHDEPRRQDANDQRGVPVVLRLTPGLDKLTAGTILEGWQSTWHVPRPLGEDHWQPTLIGLVDGGDVVVCHDGGYAARPAAGETIGYEHFYYIPDHISRLSGDLSVRRWHRRLQMPRIGRETIQKVLSNGKLRSVPAGIEWKQDSLGQTRPFRMDVSPDGQEFYIAGWSASRTSNEPWWTPFALGFDLSGKEVFSTYSPNPMSGGGGRMGGLVSDAAIRSIRVDPEGDILIAGIGDGGNSILRQDPRDYTRSVSGKDGPLRGKVHSFPGRVLFWGLVGRVDRRSGALLGGNHLSGWKRTRRGTRLAEAWATDLRGLSDGRVLVVGRHTVGFDASDDAFATGDRGGFVRLYTEEFRLVSSSTFSGAAPMELALRGRRGVLVGRISAARPLTKSTPLPPGGGQDAFLMVVEVNQP
jgi:hypothetical protein